MGQTPGLLALNSISQVSPDATSMVFLQICEWDEIGKPSAPDTRNWWPVQMYGMVVHLDIAETYPNQIAAVHIQRKGLRVCFSVYGKEIKHGFYKGKRIGPRCEIPPRKLVYSPFLQKTEIILIRTGALRTGIFYNQTAQETGIILDRNFYMGMIHISSGRIADRKGIIEKFTGINIGRRLQRRYAVHIVRNLKAMPVNTGTVGKMIDDTDRDLVSGIYMNGRAGVEPLYPRPVQ